MRKQAQWAIATLFLVLLLAAFLRLYDLGKENIWMDEGFTLGTADKQDIGVVIAETYILEINPPVYYAFIHYWMKLASSEFFLRLPSVIFGLLGVFFMYVLGRKVYNEKAGLIAALLMAVSLVNVLYSQELRVYTLFVMLVILSNIFFVNILKKGRFSDYLWYVAITALSLYSHYLTAYIILLQNAIVFLFFVFDAKLVKKWVASQAVIALLFLPWLPKFIQQMAYWTETWKSSMIGRGFVPPAFAKLGAMIFALPMAFALVVIVIMVAVIYVRRIRLSKQLAKVKYSQLWSSVFLGLFLLFSYFVMPRFTSPHFVTKYTIFVYPLLYLLMGNWISKMKKCQLLCVILIVVVSLINLSAYYSETTKEEWYKTAQFIGMSAEQGDLLLYCDGRINYAFKYYYKGDIEGISVMSSVFEEENKVFYNSVKDRLDSAKSKFLIASHCEKTNGFYQEILGRDFEFAGETGFNGITVYEYS